MKNSSLVSVVVPTLNEEKNLPRLFKSLLGRTSKSAPTLRRFAPQGKQKERMLNSNVTNFEIIIVDGGSTDRTVAIAKKFGAKVVFNPKKIRGAGCQRGVEAAKGEYIAFTDADCEVPFDWIERLRKGLGSWNGKREGLGDKNKIAAVGGPNVTPSNDSAFGKAVGSVLDLLTGVGARYGFKGKKVSEIYHNSGCNVLYKKSAILEVGGFDETLLTCEDEELDFRIRKLGYKLLYNPEVVVLHHRRSSYKGFFLQAYRYAIGRMQAGKKHPEMLKWFHFGPSLFVLLGGLGGLGILGVLGASVFLARKNRQRSFWTYFLLLLCWIVGWGLGFVRGIFYFPNKQNETVKNTWADYWRGYHGVTRIGAWSQRESLNKVFEVLEKEKISKKTKILDIGVGEGRTLLSIKEKGYEDIKGIDNTKESLEICRNKGLTIGKDIFLKEAEATGYKKGEFELVFSEGLLEHFTDPRLIIKEMARISSKHILLIQPNHFSLYGRLIAVYGHLVRGNVKEFTFRKKYFVDEFVKVGFGMKREEETRFSEFWIMLFEK